MKLGEMLQRDGRITGEQVDHAISEQRRVGGKIGSLLVELGYIDPETLTVYLGLELGIPIANGATLERCKRSAVKLLSPEQAARLRCVPIVIQGQTLVVAVDDPHDLVTLDEIGATTGYRILPRVAPEIRIYYYLERFYGVPRPKRYAALGDSPRGSTKPRDDLPAPPLPGLPSIREPTEAPTPPPVLQRLRRASGQPEEEIEDILELDAADLVGELDADKTEPAAQAPVLDERQSGPRGGDRAGTQTEHQPLDLATALAQMNGAHSRNDVARALIAFAAGIFDVTALFMVRDDMALGWKASGPNIDATRLEMLLLPLGAPSVFQAAVNSDEGSYHGPLFPATLHSYLFRGLRCKSPQLATVVVVRIGERAVNILYGHNRMLEAPDLPSLQKLTGAAAEAYVRLISGHKRMRRESEQAAELGEPRG